MKGIVKRMVISTCIMFTSFMLVGSLIAMGFVGPSSGLVLTLTFLLASVAFAILRALWFTDRIIGRLSYSLRILGFGATAFVALSGCAWLGNWFPMKNGGPVCSKGGRERAFGGNAFAAERLGGFGSRLPAVSGRFPSRVVACAGVLRRSCAWCRSAIGRAVPSADR